MTKVQPEFINILRSYRPCMEAFQWAQQFETWQQLWDSCERGDWLLWVIARTATEDDRKRITSVACECARLALPYTKDPRVLVCIETVEAWTRGEATIEQVREARRNAAAAAYAAAAAAAYADAAAYAAAAAAAAAAYADAADAADADARKQVQKQSADIVRKHWPIAPELKVKP